MPKTALTPLNASTLTSTKASETWGTLLVSAITMEELLGRKYRFWNFYSYVIAYVWEVRPIQVISVVQGARDLAVFFALRVSHDN